MVGEGKRRGKIKQLRIRQAVEGMIIVHPGKERFGWLAGIGAQLNQSPVTSLAGAILRTIWPCQLSGQRAPGLSYPAQGYVIENTLMEKRWTGLEASGEWRVIRTT